MSSNKNMQYSSRAAAEDLAGDLRSLMGNLVSAKTALVNAEVYAMTSGDYRRLPRPKAEYYATYQETLRRLLAHCGVPDEHITDITASVEDDDNA